MKYFEYNGICVWANLDGQSVSSLTSILQDGKGDLLTGYNIVQSQVPCGMQLTGNDKGDVGPLLELWKVYQREQDKGNDTSAIVEQFEFFCGLIGIQLFELLMLLPTVEQDAAILSGAKTLTRELPLPANIKLKIYVEALNKLSGFSSNKVSQTVLMRTPADQIKLKLDTPSNILTNAISNGDIQNLIKLPEDHQTILWRQRGVKEEELLGTGEYDMTYPLPNEEELVANLKALSERVKEQSNQEGIPNQLKEYFITLIYRALLANWQHTGIVPMIDAMMDDNTDDDSDSAGPEYTVVSNASFNLTIDEREELNRKLADAGHLINNGVFDNALDKVKSFLAINLAKNLSEDIYIECLVKLLRWGDRRVRKLKLFVEDRYIDTDLFDFKDDFTHLTRIPVKQYGKLYIPKGVLFFKNTIPKQKQMALGLTELPMEMVMGMICTAKYKYEEDPTASSTEDIFMDAYTIIENKDEILLLDYDPERQTFSSSEKAMLELLDGFAITVVTNEDMFKNGAAKYYSEVPKILESAVLPLTLDNKKKVGLFYTLSLLSEEVTRELTDSEMRLLSMQLPILQDIQAIGESGKLSLDRLLNCVVKSQSKLNTSASLTSAPQLSTRFQTQAAPEPVVQKKPATLPATHLQKAYTVFSEETQTPICYIATKPFGLYSLNSIVDEVARHAQFTTIAGTLKFFKEKVEAFKEAGKLSPEREELFDESIRFLEEAN